MKKITLLKAVFILLIGFPEMLAAQWHMVRFDSVSIFNKAFAITDNSVIVGGNNPFSSDGFIVRTNNGGASWDSIPLSTASATFNVVDIFFNSVNEGFIGGLKNGRQVLIKTADNGATWSEITPDSLTIDHIRSISFIDPQNGFTANTSTIYKTVDGGLNWTTLTPGFYIESIKFLDMNTGFASGELNAYGVVMKTTDGGQTWSNLLTAMTPFFFSSSMFKLDVINQNEIFSSLSYGNRMFRTIDGGISWDTIDVPNIYEIQDFDFIDANDGHLLTKMGEIFGTNDGGLNWTFEYAVSGGFYGPNVSLNSISFAGATGYVCASDGLIKKFTKVSSGLNSEFINENAQIFPNPLVDNKTLFISNVEGEYKLEIFDNVGKIVVNQRGIVSKGELIPVSNILLEQGIYTVLISGSKSTLKEKLIVVK